MSIKRRGSSYQVNLYVPGSKRRFKSFPSEREARDWEAQTRLERSAPGGGVTVRAFASTWLERYPRPKRSTVVSYEQNIRGFVERFGGHRLEDLTRPLVRLWAVEHPSQVQTARAMLGDAHRDGLVASNPLSGMRLPGSRGRRDIEALSEAQVAKLVAWAAEVHGEYGLKVYGPMIQLAAYTGLRPGEIHGLRWGDVHLRDETLRVERQYSPKANAFTATKNGLTRTVPLLPPAVEALRAIPRTTLAEVFSTKNGKRFSGRVSHYYWDPVRCGYGNPALSFYELRHAFGSMLARYGLGGPEIGRIMGHTDGGKLALERYVHISEKEAIERAKALYAMPRLKVVGE